MSEQENIFKLKAMIEASDNIVFFGMHRMYAHDSTNVIGRTL